MRLTQIKLAGFKSFVDPTLIAVPGQLVGVVGPNGCGKSNIIDAVRWVLGESKATALRGESMQDVIFNGSSLRAPVARASVELFFDNSLGKIGGPWADYAEISVKRVLERNGDSSYYINNSHVRRRDITDIFLGTGLGPRAYAIIEQGMISRIIEAKPEELRVFLEEAAGVSKYKERRRETEHRLEDARENLTRVADINRELTDQLEKLEAQAKVAAEYHDLQAQAQNKQNLFWLLKRNEASDQRNKFARDIERAQTDLEGQITQLRDIEKRLEDSRTSHYVASDKLHEAQGELYEANTEIARLDGEVRHIAETRTRLQNQITQLKSQQEQWEQQHGKLEQDLVNAQQQLAQAQQQVVHLKEATQTETQKLPAAEQAYRESQARLQTARETVIQAEQALQLEGTHHSHAQKNLQSLEVRQQRLQTEQKSLSLPNSEELDKKKEQKKELSVELKNKQSQLDALQQQLGPLTDQAKTAAQTAQEQAGELAATQARVEALMQLQENAQAASKIKPWLDGRGLGRLPRLWQKIKIDAEWETALEAVLRDRLNALEINNASELEQLIEDAPPACLTVYSIPSSAEAETPAAYLRPLLSVIRFNDERVRPLLQQWLHGVYIAETNQDALRYRSVLPPHAVLVSREGHLFSAHSVSFYAIESEQHGLLARQSEIDQLNELLLTKKNKLADTQATQHQTEEKLAATQKTVTNLREELNAIQTKFHQFEIEILKLEQDRNRAGERLKQIEQELAEINHQHEIELKNKTQAEANFERLDKELEECQESFEQVNQGHLQIEQALANQRQKIQETEKATQEAHFLERQAVNKIKEIQEAFKTIAQQQQRVASEISMLEDELANLSEKELQEGLNRVLKNRTEKEQTLANQRNAVEIAANTLRALEEERLATEQKLEPLREKINELRLKEQAAQINFDQFANQLIEAKANEETLKAQIEKSMKPNALQNEITRLQEAVAALGAVNLAALDELKIAKERKDYLDKQSQDLTEAIQTLENAIRSIDKETRALLQATFDKANEHFGQMFPKLFAGGEAKLVMTGEEILDAGVQVMAHPPGKKNSSIHLLSGGEKALTAIALVFSLFQLNPAPFCLLDEVDAPLDDNNTERFCALVKKMSEQTQFLFISHNKISMEIAHQLIGVTMQESGVSRIVAVDIEEAVRLATEEIKGAKKARAL